LTKAIAFCGGVTALLEALMLTVLSLGDWQIGDRLNQVQQCCPNATAC
jgi:hypothetical protein